MRQMLTALVLLATAAAATAQEGLSVAGVFGGRFNGRSGVRETTISGGSLAPHRLDLYRSLSFDSPGADDVALVERAVKQDGASATDREVQLRAGRLYYGFYTLPRRNSKNRYLLYLNQLAAGGDKLLVIYLEGHASAEQVKKMLK
ncbi:MAG: hypothetical protein K2L76_05390 [Muribaculaceae bacterium]|nr:hypothetical protein [Muribaculaceae bacterium]